MGMGITKRNLGVADSSSLRVMVGISGSILVAHVVLPADSHGSSRRRCITCDREAEEGAVRKHKAQRLCLQLYEF